MPFRDLDLEVDEEDLGERLLWPCAGDLARAELAGELGAGVVGIGGLSVSCCTNRGDRNMYSEPHAANRRSFEAVCVPGWSPLVPEPSCQSAPPVIMRFTTTNNHQQPSDC